MSQVQLRPATRDDLEAFSDMKNKPTAKAWVGEVDGEVLAIGGLALVRGRWIGFFDITPEARKRINQNMMVRVAWIRAFRLGLDEARKMGIRFLYAHADIEEHPQAREFLERFGFEPDPRSDQYYRWRPN